MGMISVDQALDKILSYVDILEGGQRPILDSIGQVLVEDKPMVEKGDIVKVMMLDWTEGS